MRVAQGALSDYSQTNVFVQTIAKPIPEFGDTRLGEFD